MGHAHELLAKQPGHHVAYESEYGKLATQASKMARNLGNVRNHFGGGHGRARQPRIRDEMVDLALDGGLIWVRWALRRLGLFSEGRPESLIRDLVEDRAMFRAGGIARRLEAANLPNLESRHQRALGVAVGQRAASGTFVIRDGGVIACLESDDTEAMWTPDYRIGLAQGLLFDPDERHTVRDQTLRDALMALDPIPECMADLEELVNRIVTSTEEGKIAADAAETSALNRFVLSRIVVRPTGEHAALRRLAAHVQPPLF
ncbi:abortive infection family protein [Kribbella antibiotica]|uniref:abortive infection family protein n=1 Tax=Kribbella antibiotica TaxID=190195 RepID=UPI00140557A9|nr:abortive infection family protein [Kribbella antibiotica]